MPGRVYVEAVQSGDARKLGSSVRGRRSPEGTLTGGFLVDGEEEDAMDDLGREMWHGSVIKTRLGLLDPCLL